MIMSKSSRFNYYTILPILALLLIFFLNSPASAEEKLSFTQLSKKWEKDISSVQRGVEKNAEDKDKLKEYQTSLKEIKAVAAIEASIAKEKLKTEKELLLTLGEKLENSNEEYVKVREQRDRLNQSISSIDGQLKQANLAIAQADEQLAAIETSMKQRVHEKLFAYEEFPASKEGIATLITNTQSYFEYFKNWMGLAQLCLGLIIIAAISFPLTKHINELIIKAPGIEAIKPLNCRRMMLLMWAAFFVFLMRFDIVNIQSAPAFENLLEIVASICLAMVLFIGLGRVKFIASKHSVDDMGEQKKSYSWLWNGMKKLTRLVLLLVPIMSMFGYANLGLYLAFNILATIVAALVFYWLRTLVAKLSSKLSHEEESKEGEEQLSPIAITIIEPIIGLLALGFAAFFWGMTTEDLTTLLENYKDGILIGDVTIDFVNLGSGIVTLFTVILLTRLIQWFLSSRVFPHTELDLGLREAISSITGYVGIIIAILISLGAVGLDLSNLALVIGALSVGIGFGLQAIFSNFISGLILLFERPVKVGDWVVVGDKEGTIKKIRVRSTEIQTFQNASVIVPNSQLISETVTNWTLHDKVGRVEIKVGVAYGSDTEKVREVLLAVAEDHPAVRALPAPVIIFTKFGDSSLDIELRCFIRNIRDVFTVSSELRFDVDNAFRKNKITIPFPQRDLHVKTLGEIKVDNKPAKKGKK